MAKRVRCKCGTIFDPSESGKCPSCGTEIIVAAAPPPDRAPVVAVVEKKSGPPLMSGSEGTPSDNGGTNHGSGGQWQGRKRSLLAPIAAVLVIFVAVAAAGTVVAVKYLTPVWNQYFGGGGKNLHEGDDKDKDKDKDKIKKEIAQTDDDQKKSEAAAQKRAEEKAREDDRQKTAQIAAEKAAKEKAEKELAQQEKEKTKPAGGDAKTIVENDKKEEKKEAKKPDNNSGGGSNGNTSDTSKTADNGNGKAMENKTGGNDGTDKKGADDKTAENGGGEKKGMENKTAANDSDKTDKDKEKDKVPPGPGPNPKGDEKEIHLNTTPGAAGMLTLEQAVEKLPDGGTIYLAPGTYPGGIHLTKPIHLVGESQDKDKPAVITFDGGPACLEVESESVFLERLKIEIKKPEANAEPGTKPHRPGLAAIIVQEGAVLSLVDCTIESGAKMGVNVRGAGTLKMNRGRIAGVPGTGIMFMGDGTATCTDTTFQNNRVVLMATGKNAVEFKSCVFQGNGVESGGGSAMVLANDAQVTADKCTFEHNHCGLFVNGSAILGIHDSTFTENGYTAAPPKDTNFFGVIGVVDKGQLTLTGNKFNNNHQGISIMGGGSAEIKDCHFNNTGVKDAEGAFAFYSNPLSISGKTAKVTLLKSTIDQALLGGINMVDGGTLTMEDSQVTGCPGSGLGVGAPDSEPCMVHVKNCKFNGGEKGISLTCATTADIADTECNDNEVGFDAGDAGTKVMLTKLTATGNKIIGLTSFHDAQVTGAECSLQKNKIGVQVGSPGDATLKAAMTLEKCALDGNETDARVCAASQLTLNGADFGTDGKVTIKKEKGAVVKADPPLPKGSTQLADNDDGSGGGSSSKKDASSSSGGTTKRVTPPRVRRVGPKDAIDQTIDQLGNRLKKLFH